jgi:hypothetical protein
MRLAEITSVTAHTCALHLPFGTMTGKHYTTAAAAACALRATYLCCTGPEHACTVIMCAIYVQYDWLGRSPPLSLSFCHALQLQSCTVFFEILEESTHSRGLSEARCQQGESGTGAYSRRGTGAQFDLWCRPGSPLQKCKIIRKLSLWPTRGRRSCWLPSFSTWDRPNLADFSCTAKLSSVENAG